MRDYIHVMDLAEGHIKALEYLNITDNLLVANLGTGKGSSVLQVLNAFEKAANKQIPYTFKNKRSGDVAEFYADPSLAKTLLNWEAKKDLSCMCKDHWHWQQKNPNGYE